MMTEKEYEELQKKYREADKFCDFWEESGINTLEETMSGIDDPDINYEVMKKYNEFETTNKVVGLLYKAVEVAKERREYWNERRDELYNELHSSEALALVNSWDESPSYDEPDYGISRGERIFGCEPYAIA